MPELSEEIRTFIEGGMPPLDIGEIQARAARSPIGPPQHARRRLPVALVVVGAAAALITVLVLSPWAVRGPTPAGAESELLLLASRANDVSKLGPGQYLYSEMQTLGPVSSGGPGPKSAINEYWTETDQMWINGQGYGRFVETTHDTPHFFSPEDRRNWLREGSPPSPGLEQPVRSGGIAPRLDLAPTPHFDVANLPTKTAALRAFLASSQFETQLPIEVLECHDNTTCLVVIKAAAILQGPDIGATPALRRALFELLAHVPGVVNRGTVKDHGGVSGIELSYVDRIPAHIQTDGCEHPVGPNKSNSVNVHVPASSNIFSFIVNPVTTQVIETEQVPRPSYQAVPVNPCSESPVTMKQFNPPHWVTVSKEVVVGSETSTTPVDSTHP